MKNYSFSFTDNSEAFRQAMRKNAPVLAEALGIQAQSHVIANITAAGRVDTGLMRNSVAYAVGGQSAVPETYRADNSGDSGSYSGTAPNDPPGLYSVYIGSNTDYFKYQELGFRLPNGAHVAGMHALKSGVEQLYGEAEQIAEAVLKYAPEG